MSDTKTSFGCEPVRFGVRVGVGVRVRVRGAFAGRRLPSDGCTVDRVVGYGESVRGVSMSFPLPLARAVEYRLCRDR